MALPIHIFFGHDITAKMSGMALREVVCSHCGERYVYQLRRTGHGDAYAPLHIRTRALREQAQRSAQEDLQNMLRSGEDFVPCPACGYVQPSMVRLRREAWLRGLAWAFVPIAVIAAAALYLEWKPFLQWDSRWLLKAAGALGAGWLAMLMWAIISNPNRRAHQRTREALGPKCRALPQREFKSLSDGDPPA
jgi:hypothetical protein